MQEHRSEYDSAVRTFYPTLSSSEEVQRFSQLELPSLELQFLLIR